MPELKGTKTSENLKYAFAGESQANRRYSTLAKQADIEGLPGGRRPVPRHRRGRDRPRTRPPRLPQEGRRPGHRHAVVDVPEMLASAVAGETHEYTDMYPGMAKTAREEGFRRSPTGSRRSPKAERSHAGKFQKALESM